MKSRNMLRTFYLGIIVSFLLLISHTGLAANTVKLGVLAKRGSAIAIKKWKPLAQYLSSQTGTNFVLLPLSFDAIEPAVRLKKIDYLIANPGFFVTLQKKYGVSALASLLNLRQGQALNRFGGVIFVRNDSPINSVAQLKNKRFMCVKLSSFGGGQMAFRHLLKKGINPFKDFSALVEGKKHDNVVMAVRRGVVAAGTVRSDTLERMSAEGKISMSEFKVLDKVNDDFPFVHSTILYPEWPFAACAHSNDNLNKKITSALLALKADNPAAKAAKIAGWTTPLDYTPVAECLEEVAAKR